LNENVSFDFVHRQQDVFHHDDHGTEVFSVIAAYQEGDFTGGAYKANFQLYITEDIKSEYRIEEYNWLFAAERSDSLGVDIVNTSLGYNDFDLSSMDYSMEDMDGATTVITRAAQMAAERGMIVVTSAGNEGNKSWQIVTAPADAVDVLAVGAVNSLGERTAISSKGPTADNRIKPDVVALGSATAVIKSTGAPGSASGTSLASPLVASLAAGVWQRYPEMTNLEVIDILRKSASQAINPDNFLGYGIPNFKAVVNLKEWTPQDEIFTVFPNPVLETVNIRPNNPEEIASCFLEVVSVRGEILTSQAIAFNWLNRTYTAQATDLPVGVYVLRIRHNNRIYTYKLVKL
jgi:subtilisin family serine protease